MPAILQVAMQAPRGSPRIPSWSQLLPLTCTNSRSTASAVTRHPCPFRPVRRSPASGGGKSEGNTGCHLTRVPPTSSPPSLATLRVVARVCAHSLRLGKACSDRLRGAAAAEAAPRTTRDRGCAGPSGRPLLCKSARPLRAALAFRHGYWRWSTVLGEVKEVERWER
jgi:hypothetical protein